MFYPRDTHLQDREQYLIIDGGAMSYDPSIVSRVFMQIGVSRLLANGDLPAATRRR
jgi:hypothetical protein